MYYQLTLNVLQRTWKYQTLLAVMLLLFISPSVSAEKYHNNQSITFEDISTLLGPYSRAASGEGLGGIAWLDYDQDGDLDFLSNN